jgi:polyhydroxybutyrate depolymerase
MKSPNAGKCLLIVLIIIFFLFPIISFAQIDSSSFIFEGIERNYLVFLPTDYNGTEKMPVVFNLHGYTLNAHQQMDYSRMNIVADSEGFIAVYPNAAGPGWNTGISGSPNINDVGFFDALIDTLSEHYSIDTTRIYSCGFSLGGFMSNRLACELSNRINGVATVAGTMAQSIANSCSPNHPMPELLIHGTNDLCVSYNGQYDWLSVQQKLDHWTNFNFCTESDTTLLPDLDTLDGCTVQKINFTHCSDSVSVILYKVISGGHSWPGGDTSKLHLSEPWCPEVGTTNFDISASQEIWNFFNKDYITAVENYSEYPGEFSLYQNYPNPFNPSTKISYQIPEVSNVTLKIFNLLGEEVVTLVNNEYQNAGTHSSLFIRNSTLPSGVYFYQLKAGGFVETKKMLLLK